MVHTRSGRFWSEAKVSIAFTKKNGVINEEVALDDEVIVNSVTTLCHSDYNYIEQTFRQHTSMGFFRIAAQGLCWKKRYANRSIDGYPQRQPK